MACFVINRGACVYCLRLAVDLGESFRREGGRGLEKRVRRRQVTKVNVNCVSGVDSVPVTWIDERVTSPLWSSSPNPRAQSNPVKSVRGSPTRGRPAAPRIAVKVIGSQEGLSRPAGASGDATERPVVSWTASGSGRGAGERPRQQEGRVGLGGGEGTGSAPAGSRAILGQTSRPGELASGGAWEAGRGGSSPRGGEWSERGVSTAAGCRAVCSSSCFCLCRELGLRREGARQ